LFLGFVLGLDTLVSHSSRTAVFVVGAAAVVVGRSTVRWGFAGLTVDFFFNLHGGCLGIGSKSAFGVEFGLTVRLASSNSLISRRC